MALIYIRFLLLFLYFHPKIQHSYFPGPCSVLGSALPVTVEATAELRPTPHMIPVLMRVGEAGGAWPNKMGI